uniref:Transcription elongation factor 1 homolog n=1 Tax=Rhabditophanes sp. KR3021 TaxID=114890 RepID=A0AC35TRQ3_9BILA
MGKRKSSARKAPTKVKAIMPMPKIFPCIYCQVEDSVECRLDLTKNIGVVNCRNCSEGFSMKIHYLNLEIDVYNAWVDHLEELNNDDNDGGGERKRSKKTRHDDDSD